MRKQNRVQQNCRSIFRKLLRSIPHRPDDAARWKHDPKCSSSRTVISAAHPWLQACSIILIIYVYISIYAIDTHYDDTSRKKKYNLPRPKSQRQMIQNILMRELYILAGSNPTGVGVSRQPVDAESAAIRNSLQQLIQSRTHGSESNSRL